VWLGENFNSNMLGFFQKEIFPMPIKIKITKHLKILYQFKKRNAVNLVFWTHLSTWNNCEPKINQCWETWWSFDAKNKPSFGQKVNLCTFACRLLHSIYRFYMQTALNKTDIQLFGAIVANVGLFILAILFHRPLISLCKTA